MNIIIRILIISLFILSVPSRAQRAVDSSKTYYLDPIVVTATQLEISRSRVPNAISTVTKEDIRASGETSVLPVIGRLVPGVFITERGILGYGVSNGAAGTIMIRGTGAGPNTEVLVLTDGRPQMMGLMGHPLPDTYVNSGVERVEIIRGPASLLYGTNAMGGVVNIIYEKPTLPGQTLDAGASYGTFNTQKYEVAERYGFNGGGVAATGNHYRTDGQRAYSSFKSNNGSVRANYFLNDNYSLSADINITGFRTYDPGPASAPLVNNWVDITRGSSGISLENRSEGVHGEFKTFFNWGRHDIYDGFHSTDNNLGLVFYEGVRLFADNETTIGADLKQYGGNAENRTTGYSYGDHAVNEYGVYFLFKQQLLPVLDVIAGVRLNRHNLYGWESVPQIGLAYQATASTTLKTSMSKGFRSPTIRELYLFPAPTPTLQPERLWNYEAGLIQNVGDRASVEFTGFLAEGSNLILTKGAFPNLTLDNSGTFTHRGIEFSGKIKPASNLDLDLSYTYLDPGDQTNANPRHKFYAGGSYRMASLALTTGLQYISRLYGADFSKRPLPDYALLNVRATVPVTGGLSTYLAAENLFDRQYQILTGYPMPGRTLFAGVNWAIQ